jgi:dipeptidyl aminopeptidase/acylaminoacyl peptidase
MRRLTVVIGLVIWLLAAAQTASGAFPGANGKIAFHSDHDGNNEIYTANPDLVSQTRLTNDPASDSDPAWSPDGQRIAFVSHRNGNYEIYKMNADGSSQTRLTTNTDYDADPSWSADGSQIVFTSGRDSNFEIYKMNADGTGQVRLTTNAASDGFPAWSPWGNKIAFQTNRDGNFEIYSMNPDGTGQSNLTRNTATDETPAWSPNGEQIAFETNRDGAALIYTMDIDGVDQRFFDMGVFGEFRFPAWSPSGTRLATQFTPGGGQFEILVFDPSNIFTTNSSVAAAPDWQPVFRNHVRPVAATPLRYSLVPAYRRCSAPNSMHEAPQAFGACVSPMPESDWLTVGTPDANGKPAKSQGSVTLRAVLGDPSTPANDADLNIALSITDVRKQSDLSDYGGGMTFSASVRATDKRNAPNSGFTRSGTSIDVPFVVDVACAMTADTSVGSTCAVDTTANSLVPDAILESKRSVWQLSDIEVFDGGSDGVSSTYPNTLFETEGVFIP